MLYKAYLFTDKDPMIDKLRTVYQDMGSPSFTHIEDMGGPSAGTVSGWFVGGTRRPQLSSVIAFLHAIGHDMIIKPAKNSVHYASEAEMQAARVLVEQERAARAAERREKRKGLVNRPPKAREARMGHRHAR